MAAMHGPHHVAQNSRTTTLPLSASQLTFPSPGACNTFSKPSGGGFSPTFSSLTSPRTAGQMPTAITHEKTTNVFFMEIVTNKEVARSTIRWEGRDAPARAQLEVAC